MAYWRDYMEAMIAAQQAIIEHQASTIEEAARVITQSLRRDGVLHMFGSGHSHLPPEEAFYRSGGLAAVSPLLDPSLMFHEGTEKCIALEKCAIDASQIEFAREFVLVKKRSRNERHRGVIKQAERGGDPECD